MAIKYKWLVEQLREIISDSIQKGKQQASHRTGAGCQIPCQPTNGPGCAGGS